MQSDEAASVIEPRSIRIRSKMVSRLTRGYFLVICILFIIVIMLCANNFKLYNTYMEGKKDFNEACVNLNNLIENKNELLKENENLLKRSKELEESFSKITGEKSEIFNQLEEIRKKNDELSKQNEELNKKNQTLVGDNVELQNTLKKAASAGIKPQNYTHFGGISNRSEIDRGQYIGKFTGTAYTPSKDECGNNKGITYSGKPIIAGVSIAVDNKYWPLGTIFYIKGLGYAVAMDTGGAIKGKYRFDFAVFDKQFAKNLGVSKWEVYMIKKGNGKVGDIKL